jgi:hypothetical protein
MMSRGLQKKTETLRGDMTVKAGSWLEFAMLTGVCENLSAPVLRAIFSTPTNCLQG